jgi:hypothetical protein
MIEFTPSGEGDLRDARIAELERKVREWDERWNRLEWCHSGCKDGTPSNGRGGPTIGGGGGLLG